MGTQKVRTSPYHAQTDRQVEQAHQTLMYMIGKLSPNIYQSWYMFMLPIGILKARTTPVIIINTNRYNVWVRQPLLAAKLYDVECDEIEYRTTMDWGDDNISIGFQPVPPQLIDTSTCWMEAGPIQPTSP